MRLQEVSRDVSPWGGWVVVVGSSLVSPSLNVGFWKGSSVDPSQSKRPLRFTFAGVRVYLKCRSVKCQNFVF